MGWHPSKAGMLGKKEFEGVKGKEGEGQGMVEWKGGGMREVINARARASLKEEPFTTNYQLPMYI